MKSDFVGIEEADLISSEAKPKISSALADFILASARISFLQEFKFIHKTAENIFLFFPLILTEKVALIRKAILH